MRMDSSPVLGAIEWSTCCRSYKFVLEMVRAGPFSTYQEALNAATDIWFNKVDVNGWLEAFSAYPRIGESPSKKRKRLDMINNSCPKWSKGEQSTALATATDSTLQELHEWNTRYRLKFGFVFLTFASGRSTPEILAEMKRRYQNRPIVEFEVAAKEQMKIIELRLSKLFSANATAASATNTQYSADVAKAGEDRMSIICGHLAALNETPAVKSSQTFTRTRLPITTHVLDVAHGSPAADSEVLLEMRDKNQSQPLFGVADSSGWKIQGSSTTDKDGRSGQLMNMVDALNPGIYRISFNTKKYNPDGFFPYVSIVL